MLEHFLQGLLKAKCLSVRTVSCHCIDRVRNHDDSGTNWYSLTHKTIRIAGAIIVLMMVPNVYLYPSAELCNCSCEVRAANGMGLHQHALFRRKPSCLTKKGCKVLVYLADIMQECRCTYLIDVFGL